MPELNYVEVARRAADRMLARVGRRQHAAAPEDRLEPTLTPEPAHALDEVLPATVFIRYDTAGQISERAVSLSRIWSDGSATYFRGVCHLRNAVRSFRTDRVSELICLATGEVAEDPRAWLLAHALFERTDPTAEALRATRDELTILAYMANADGHLDPDEVEVIIDLVMMATEDEIDRDHVAAHVRRLTPSASEIEGALNSIVADPKRLGALRRAKRRLVDADGKLQVAEQLAAVEIAAYIETRLG